MTPSEKYYKKHRQEVIKRSYYWYQRNKIRVKNNHYKQKYGITLAEAKILLIKQGGCCANLKCLVKGKWTKRKWHVDHDHKTNKVRGILCLRCNVALGMCDDEISLLEGLISYLGATVDRKRIA